MPIFGFLAYLASDVRVLMLSQNVHCCHWYYLCTLLQDTWLIIVT